MATQAEETLHRCLEVILIGPVCTGKSTLAPLLADRLQVPQVSLDRISLTYFPRDACMTSLPRQRGGFPTS
jgi:ATP-dependent protease Clp ATPase subunit